jgi:exopolyphosphatase/guanosine-5'-triphosphate,3'-diphosphate pyrophosphatase
LSRDRIRLEAMRIDVLDLGSNTFHLLAATVSNGRVEPIEDSSIAVRIGDGAFAEGRITDTAFARGLHAIDHLIGMAVGLPVTVATGVFREVANASAFFDEARRRFGLEITLLSGEDEARLTYHGVLTEALDPDGRIAMFDLGGGSLECLIGERGEVQLADSLPLGALRLARCTSAEVRARVSVVAGPALRAIRDRDPDEVLLSSGTARAVLRLARHLGHRELVTRCLSAAALREIAALLGRLSPSEIAELGVAASRCDTIAAGAMVLATVADTVGVPLVRIAATALREGVALEAAAAQRRVGGSHSQVASISPSMRW